MKVGLLVIPDTDGKNEAMDWDHNVDYSVDNLHLYDSKHDFRTWHSYPACTGGLAMVYGLPGWEKILECEMVIVTIFSNIYGAVDPILKLKDRGIVVGIAYHENIQTLQYAISNNPAFIYQLCDLIGITGTDFILYSTPYQAGLVWESLSNLERINVHYVPFAYPAHISNNYKIQAKDRSGIFLGCSIRRTLLKHNITILLLVSELTKKHNTHAVITTSHSGIHCFDPWFMDNGINRLIVEPFADCHNFLKIYARCKLCVNLDFSLAQGQNAFDAALVGIPCIGGTSDGQQILYPDLAFDTTNLDTIIKYAELCLTDNDFNQKEADAGLRRLQKHCSFEAIQNRLNTIYKLYKRA